VELVRDLVWVAGGGAVGSALRYLVGVWLSQRVSHGFPWHTFAVNVVGAFALGLLMTAIVDRGGWGHWQLFGGVGLLGGFTTFSTLSYETLRLFEDGLVTAGLANAAGSVIVGLAAVALGVAVGRAL
jgi:CrcB protein